jgi:acetaldehyde dehydrogenase
MSVNRVAAAIIGSGNIGTDLMIKIMRQSRYLEVGAMVGIDPKSDGLARAGRLGVTCTSDGIEGLTKLDGFDRIKIAFDATSAAAHPRHNEILRAHGIRVIDLTPAAIGPYVVPSINIHEHLQSQNINMVTCGGEATIPIVAAVSSVAEVIYAEIVASIASKSAGPGTRANIDEFTVTTARGLEVLGGAKKGKAIIVLNPAEPPLMMRDTIFTLSRDADEGKIRDAVLAMIARVQQYVPGYRLKQDIQIERIGSNNPVSIPGLGTFTGIKTTVLLEVEGAAHYLPSYAGNLDIMTSAALATGDEIAARMMEVAA